MYTRLVRIMLFLIATLWFCGCCGSTVRPGQMGLKWRPATTGLREKPVREGFYWHMPWNDVLTFSLQWKSFTERIKVLTKDDLHIVLEVSVVIRPLAEELYQLQLEVGPDFYLNIVKPKFFTVVRSTLANYTMVEIPEKSPEVEMRALKELKDRIKGKHLEVDNITINHIDFTTGVLMAIEKKLAKQQEKKQMEFELEIAVKEVEIASVKAKGVADALKIRSKGEAEAQKIRAAGQAEAQKMINQTLTPRFLQYKAFDSPNAKFIYVPIGKDGLPIIISPGDR